MKKIVQLITFLNDAGAENLVKNYCLNLDRTRFEPIVVTIFDLNNDCSVYRSIQENGIRIVSVYDKSWKKSRFQQKVEAYCQEDHYSLFGRVWNKGLEAIVNKHLYQHVDRTIGRELGKVLRSIRPDIIHAHLHVHNYLRWAKFSEAKLYYTCHSEPHRYFSEREYDNTKYLIEKYDMQIIALHRAMQFDINALFGINNTIVLNNWIDFSRFSSVNEPKGLIRKSLGVSQDAFIIGTVGRIEEFKNQIFLVDVLNNLIAEKPDSFLIIAGKGPDSVKDRIVMRAKEYGIENRIKFLGTRTDIERVYRAFDVFMLPSVFEGFALAAVEAQAAGLRCLLSDALPKEVCLSKTTFFLPIHDSKIWAKYAIEGNENEGDYGDIHDYDVHSGIKVLENLYGEQDEKEEILNFN